VGLASSTLTNTGPGVFVGNVGVSPGTSVTGFPPGTVRRGTIYGWSGCSSGADRCQQCV
jgi:hypothetical protein